MDEWNELSYHSLNDAVIDRAQLLHIKPVADERDIVATERCGFGATVDSKLVQRQIDSSFAGLSYRTQTSGEYEGHTGALC
ncbi:MAG TPA: hypothetical protein VNM92_10230 [Thermoanaerobaculia bacterium]|nr:hypothetical protein [Thermoanaerobaculia bacterium]